MPPPGCGFTLQAHLASWLFSQEPRLQRSDGGSYDYATAAAAALPGLTQALGAAMERFAK
ncbi:hypothetical protein GCM10010080_30780 [Thermomonas carbonis]|nr:hypothetical protein GCM10010080_30780 [Thermomonas carbonis]